MIPLSDHNVGQVEMDDDHSDDEEAAIYDAQEVPAESSEDESSESESASDSGAVREAAVVTRGRARVRACLPGCDCERPYGRKCECEKRSNGLCTVDCKCDRSKCRTTVKDLSSDSEELED
jgi:hypothetical protein